MDHGLSKLAAQVETLGERIARVERYLGLAGAPIRAKPSQERSSPPAVELVPPTSPQQPPSAVVAAAAPPLQREVRSPLNLGAPRASVPVARPKWRAPDESLPTPRSAFSVEKIIGARLFAGVGALAIVVGAGLFLKYAYDQGWMGRVPPLGKCALAAAFGFVLLGCGEWARRRISALASAGLSSAGVGVLYATAFGAYAQWGLVSSAGAMGLLVGACVIGLGIGARAGLVFVAALSLVGGYSAPLVIGAQTPISPMFLPSYLVALFVVGLALSGWKGRAVPSFHHLRTLCWLGTGGLGTIWLLASGIPDHQGIALMFLGAVWSVTHIERIATLQGLLRGPAQGDGLFDPSGRERTPFREGRAIVGSFSATAWATGFGAWALESGALAPRWWAPAALLLPVAAFGFAFAGLMRGLREPPHTQVERFGVGLLAQAGALVIVAIALALSGWTQAIAWLALGLASIATGRAIHSRALDWYGVIALSFATARLAALIALGESAGGAGAGYWGIYIDLNSSRIALTAAAWLVAAGLLLIRLGGARPWGASVATLVGLTLLLFVPLHGRSEVGPICMAWIGVGAAALLAGCRITFGADRMVNRAMINFGLIAMTLGALRQVGLTLDTLKSGADGVLIAGLFVTPNTWRIVTGAIVWLGAAALLLRNHRNHMPGRTVAASHVGLALLALAPVHSRTADEAVCLVWVGLASAAFAAGARLLPRWMGWSFSGIALLVLSTGAWISASFSNGWNSSIAPIGLHAGLWTAILIGAVGVAAARWFNPLERHSIARARVGDVSWALAIALFFVASSFEVARGATEWAAQERARQAVLSIYWGLFAVALLVAGFLRGKPVVRYAGLGLMGVAAVKAVLVDLSAAPPAWRIASFMGLGLLMVGVALAYARITARLDGARSQPASPDDPDATNTEERL